MKKLGLLGLGIAGLLFQVCLAQAQSTTTSGGILLNNPASVRAEGMGRAQAAITTDEAGAMGYNPAGLFNNPAQGISAVYYKGMVDDMFGGGFYDQPLTPAFSVGAGLVMYDAGSFDLDDSSGNSSKVSALRDFLGTVTGAYHMDFAPLGLAVGASLKAVQSTLLGKYSAFAVAGDLGARVEGKDALKNLSLGVAVKNLGTAMKYVDASDPLPVYGLAGLGYNWPIDPQFGVLVAADVQTDLDKATRYNLGAEFLIANMISLRAGYISGADLAGFNAGAGFQLDVFQLDYSFSFMQALSSVHRISLKYVLGTPASNQPAAAAPETAEPTPAYAVAPYQVVQQAEGPVQKVPAEIVEVQKAGGRASNVIMKMGSKQGIKVGYKGTLLDASGHPVAGFIIRQVDAELCLAEIIGLSQEIGNDIKAVIDKPISK